MGEISHKLYQVLSRQDEVMDYIFHYRFENSGINPSLRDIADNTSVRSASTAKFYVDRLVEQGYLARVKKINRGLVLLVGSYEEYKAKELEKAFP